MEIRQLIFVMLGIFSVFLIVVAMGETNLQSANWTLLNQNLAVFFVFIVALAFVVWFLKENR